MPRSKSTRRAARELLHLLLLLLILILLALLLYKSQTRTAPPTPVPPEKHFVYAGFPKGPPLTILTNRAYAVGYDEQRKNPLWVAYRVFAGNHHQLAPRPDRFSIDERTHARVSHDDYTGSGFDRGHMAPNYAVGTRFGQTAQLETFLMSNIIPQPPTLNRELWRRIELLVADQYAHHFEQIWVITGPVFDNDVTQLPAGIEIPDACYTILLDEHHHQPRALAFLIPQSAATDARPEDFLVTIDHIEQLTNLDFLPDLPDDVEIPLEAHLSTTLWPSPN